jgi:hypothetical protein
MPFALAPDMVLVKTDKGLAELASRQYGLSHELRSALIQVDGRRTVAKILATWSQWPALAEALALLVEQGFVAPAAAAVSPSAAAVTSAPKAELVALARALLGDNAAPVVARLERSGDDAASLNAAVDACSKLVLLTIDEDKAGSFAEAARAILARAR